MCPLMKFIEALIQRNRVDVGIESETTKTSHHKALSEIPGTLIYSMIFQINVGSNLVVIQWNNKLAVMYFWYVNIHHMRCRSASIQIHGPNATSLAHVVNVLHKRQNYSKKLSCDDILISAEYFPSKNCWKKHPTGRSI